MFTGKKPKLRKVICLESCASDKQNQDLNPKLPDPRPDSKLSPGIQASAGVGGGGWEADSNSVSGHAAGSLDEFFQQAARKA